MQSIKCKKSMTKKSVLFLGVIFFYTILAIVLQPVFETVDDENMRSIISGVYSGSPDGHAIYMHYPLTWGLSMLYKYFGASVPWYGLAYMIFFVISTYIILKEMVFYTYQNRKNKYLGIFLSGVYVLILINFFIIQQFTVIAGLLGGIAIFCFVIKKNKIEAIVFLALSFMVRSDVFLMVCPFFVAVELWKNLSEKVTVSMIIKKTVPVLLILVGIFLCGNGVEWLNYQEQGYQNYKNYNKAFNGLYDYTDLPFNNQNKYKEEVVAAGVDSGEYDVIRTYNLNLDHSIDVEMLDRVTNIAQKKMQKNSVKNIAKFLPSLLVKKTFAMQTIFIGILYLIVIIILIEQKMWKRLLITTSVLIGKWGIILYFCYMGRVVERVISSLWLVECFFVLTILVILRNEKEWKLKNNKRIYLANIGIFAVLILLSTRNMFRLKEYHEIIKPYVTIADYCRERKDNHYFLDMITDYGYLSYTLKENVTTQNQMFMGGWMSRHPLVEAKLHEWGGIDAAEILKNDTHAYYIVSDTLDKMWLEQYFKERYRAGRLKAVDQIECGTGRTFSVYRLVKD